MMRYSEKFKAQMVRKMAAPGGPSASGLSKQEGIAQTTLSRWLREAGRVEGMTKSTMKPKRPQDWTAQEKLELVLESASLGDDELGGLLRRRGVHQAQLEQWREQMLSGLESEPKRNASTAQKRQIRTLERELRRKEKALAEASALLVLQKKARAIWGDEDDDTALRSER